MTRKVFFSFHFERDAWRAGIVRNSNVTNDDAGYLDAASWEEVKKKRRIEEWIDEQLDGTSVTAVLIGAETSTRKYVKYELEESWKRGNGILGIYIHQLKDQNGYIGAKGSTDFGIIFKDRYDEQSFNERFAIYDWNNDNGYINFGDWVEQAAQESGR